MTDFKTLAIDDDPSSLELVTSALQQGGVEIISAARIRGTDLPFFVGITRRSSSWICAEVSEKPDARGAYPSCRDQEGRNPLSHGY